MKLHGFLRVFYIVLVIYALVTPLKTRLIISVALESSAREQGVSQYSTVLHLNRPVPTRYLVLPYCIELHQTTPYSCVHNYSPFGSHRVQLLFLFFKYCSARNIPSVLSIHFIPNIPFSVVPLTFKPVILFTSYSSSSLPPYMYKSS